MNYIQSFYESLGKYGCYFLLIIKLAEKITKKKINIIQTVIEAQKKGWLYYNFDNHKDDNNFFVKNPAKLLSYLTNKNYVVWKATADYTPAHNEYEVLFYATNQSNADKGIGHFTLPDYDTIQNSNTVKFGKVFSKRIFKEVV